MGRRLRRGDKVTLAPTQPVGTVDHRDNHLVYVQWPDHDGLTIQDEDQLVRVDHTE